ncbi:MAG: response regulator [Polyangiaceae bacterium]
MTEERGRIVVLDDSWLILEKIREVLTGVGYQARTTTSVEVAAKLAKHADLVIIDFHMPDMNGAEALGAIKRAHTAGPGTEFYLYTSDPDQAARYRAHGFDGAFLKKGDDVALTQQVDAVFRTISLKKLAERMRRERKSS